MGHDYSSVPGLIIIVAFMDHRGEGIRAGVPNGGRMAVLLLLFLGSGASALVYEVLWLRDLGRLFGVTALAMSTTLAVFFLGLALGSYFWGGRASHAKNPLRLYALLEFGIAATAVLFFLIFALYRMLYRELFDLVGDAPTSWLLVKLFLALVILLPPTILMGGTVPVMAQYLAPRASILGRRVSLLYAVNTLGAAIGAWCAGFYLPISFGFTGAYFFAMGINIAVGAIAFILSRKETAGQIQVSHGESITAENDKQPGRLPYILVVAGASGFLTLAIEVLWTHMFSQVLHNSVYTYAIVLSIFLVALALGSGLAHLLMRLRWDPQVIVPTLLILAGILIGLTPLVFQKLNAGLKVFGEGLGWSAYLAQSLKLGVAIILIPGIIAGTVFPYLLKACEPGSSHSSRTVGYLLSLNTMSGIVGSLAAGFILLQILGLWRSIQFVAIGYALLAGAMGLLATRTRVLQISLSILGVLVVAVIAWQSPMASVYLDESLGEKTVWLKEGRHGTIAVVDRNSDLRLKVDNSYLLGTSQSAPNLRMQSWIPLCLHPDPKTVFYLGMGTGITASGALPFPVEQIVITELNPDVIEADSLFYAPWLGGLFSDVRVRIVAEDGRNYLYATEEQFDLIISDIFLTHLAGAGNLYALEHYKIAAERLTADGLFVQWLPMFELSEAEFAIIAATMSRVFPQLTLWRRGFSPRFPVAAIIGHKRAEPLDLQKLSDNVASFAKRAGLSGDLWFVNIPMAAYMGNLSSLSEEIASAEINTDNRPVIEYIAPRVQREAQAAGVTATLAYESLGRFSARLLDLLPPSRDSYIQHLSQREVDQVMAGLNYYLYTDAQRSGSIDEAGRYLARYRQLVGPDSTTGHIPSP